LTGDEAGEEIRAALERIQARPELARSPQLSKFLAYIVERTLAGEAAAIKAYTIAVDVFGRPADFDPQADPIVRVQARRLRAVLDEYNSGAGAGERVRITLPTGRYVPEFEMRSAGEETPVADSRTELEPEAEPHARPPPRRLAERSQTALIGVAVLMVVALIASLAMVLLRERPPAPDTGLRAPRVLIAEFQDLTGGSTQMQLVSGLAIELVTDLKLFEDIAVSYMDPSRPGSLGQDFVLTGIARAVGSTVQYSAVLTDAQNDAVVWSHVIERPAAEMRAAGAMDAVSREMALILGNARGPVHAAARQAALGNADFAGRESVYACLVLFHAYRDTADAGLGDRALRCLDALGEAAQAHHLALAARAGLVWDGIAGPGLDAAERAEQAGGLIEQAMRADATSSFVWEQRGWHHRRLGETAQARGDFSSALQLNPANADATAALANMLALAGETEAATALAAEVMERTPEPIPDWQLAAPAITAFRHGDLAAALEFSQSLSRVERGLGPALAVAIAARIGNGGAVNRFLPQLLEHGEFRRNGIVPVLRLQIEDTILLADIRSGLMAAGVPAQALNGPF
jgi:TolB-like protein/lipopolysaccharide biosynthesis regulator YciM